MKNKLYFKKDVYWKDRGNYSRRLNINCRICGALVITYQKDGSGKLLRLYFDRIISPKKLAILQNKKLETVQNLKCPKCHESLGIPQYYSREKRGKRKSFRLFQNAITKKVRKLN